MRKARRANALVATIEPPSAVAPARPLTTDALEKLVSQIRYVARASAIDGALEIGSLVVNELYGGLAQYRERGQTDISFRRLAAHPSLPFSAATLSRFVGVYDLVQRLPGIKDSKYVEFAHLRSVLGLPADTQERLLRAAEKDRMTAEQLREKAAAMRSAQPTRRGRPPTPAALKTLRRFEEVFAGGTLAEDTAAFGRMDRDEAHRADEVIRHVREWCEAAQSVLARRLDTIDAPED